LPDDEQPTVQRLPVDLAANARSLGAKVITCTSYDDFAAALPQAKQNAHTTVIYIRNDRYVGVPGYGSWWDVSPAEVSDSPTVQVARREWEAMRAKERHFL
jgi:3D-(3,5/4)-trihydroxycyclohexane-1,2-dione acylhydrolase (decyclizing)